MAKICLVAGAAGGIGFAMVGRLRQQGEIVTAIDVDSSAEVHVDVRSHENWEQVVNDVLETYGRGIDVLTTSQGSRSAKFFDLPVDGISYHLDVNVRRRGLARQNATQGKSS